jgi:hypothetical protein
MRRSMQAANSGDGETMLRHLLEVYPMSFMTMNLKDAVGYAWYSTAGGGGP